MFAYLHIVSYTPLTSLLFVHGQGAELFPAKSMGEQGLTFVKSLQGTQMFSEYCIQRRKLSKQARDHLETGTVDSSVDEDEYRAADRGHDNGAGNKFDVANEAQQNAALLSIETLSSPTPSGKERENMLSPPLSTNNSGAGAPGDLLVTFFQVMLTGTAPMGNQRLHTLRLAYSHNESSLDHSFVGTKVAGISNAEAMGSSVLPPTDLESEIYWCNGRCGGAADTETCTSLCLQLWEQRVKLFTHHLAVKEIVGRNVHSALVLHPVKLDNGDVISIKPNVAPVKHPRETVSQYVQRNRFVETKRQEEAVNEAYNITSQTPNGLPISYVPVIDGRHTYTPLKESVSKTRIDWGSPVTKLGRRFTLPSSSLSDSSSENTNPNNNAKNKITDSARKFHRSGVAYRLNSGSDGCVWFPPPKDVPTATNRRCRLYASERASPAVRAIARHYVKLQLTRRKSKLRVAASRIYVCLMRVRFQKYFRERAQAAKSIQKIVRGRFLRRRLSQLKLDLVAYKQERHGAALIITNWLRNMAARKEKELENLIAFQRLMNSRSPTQLPIASVEQQRNKSITRTLWSPPMYNPQPLLDPITSPTNMNLGLSTHPPSMISPPPDNSMLLHDYPSHFQAISGSASSKDDEVYLLAPLGTDGFPAPVATGASILSRPAPTQSAVANIFGTVGSAVNGSQKAAEPIHGHGLSQLKPNSAEIKKSKGHAASKFFNKVFGTHEAQKDKEKDKVPKSVSAIRQSGSSSKGFNRFSSNNNLLSGSTSATARFAVSAVTAKPHDEAALFATNRTESKFSVLEAEEDSIHGEVVLRSLGPTGANRLGNHDSSHHSTNSLSAETTIKTYQHSPKERSTGAAVVILPKATKAVASKGVPVKSVSIPISKSTCRGVVK
jgi:hypothetical protein